MLVFYTAKPLYDFNKMKNIYIVICFKHSKKKKKFFQVFESNIFPLNCQSVASSAIKE